LPRDLGASAGAMTQQLHTTKLFSKIYGGMIGAAIGDAMGGPVEGLHFEDIEKRHGVVDTFLPYTKEPSEHAQFTNHSGSYTDDTRLHLILCQAIIETQGHVTRGDFAKAITDYHYTHTGKLEQSFIEEYYLKGLYGSRKLIYGGQPTNGAIMGNAVIGLIHPANPKAAFETGYELAYITDGYAKESAAISVAAIAAAMRPNATVESLIQEALDTAAWFRREGPLWAETIRAREWARFEGRPNQELIHAAINIAKKYHDVFEIRAELYEVLRVSPVGSEAGQTLAVALAMLVAAKGDFRQTIIGCVNYGRDNDSYATVAGAIAGALNSSEAIPRDWIETVLQANPESNLRDVSIKLTEIALSKHQEHQRTVYDVEGLL
jgi:ADP-ribosylglycohydrolase